MVTNLQEVNKGRRRMLVGVAAFAGTVIAADALLKAEPAYAAVTSVSNTLVERRRKVLEQQSQTQAQPLQNRQTIHNQAQSAALIENNADSSPTPDPTTVAAQKEKAVQDSIAAKNANDWWRTNALSILGSIAGLSGLATVAVGIWQYNINQRIDREKREEERFQSAVSELGKDDTRVGAANALQIFLREGRGNAEFSRQCFDLAVEQLRKREVKPDEPLDSFTRVMTRVFTRSFKLERDRLKKIASASVPYDPRVLDASGVKLDGADIADVDLADAWMPGASFNGANLYKAQLDRAHLDRASFRKAELTQASMQDAHLRNADFTEANLTEAMLSGVNLGGVIFQNTRLTRANLSRAIWINEQLAALIKPIVDSKDFTGLAGIFAGREDLFEEVASSKVNFQKATLIEANLTGAKLHGADFTEAVLIKANLTETNLKGAYFTKADLTSADVSRSNIEWSLDFAGGSMVGVIGLSEEQRSICETIKHASFTAPTLDTDTASYFQNILDLTMDQLQDRL